MLAINPISGLKQFIVVAEAPIIAGHTYYLGQGAEGAVFENGGPYYVNTIDVQELKQSHLPFIQNWEPTTGNCYTIGNLQTGQPPAIIGASATTINCFKPDIGLIASILPSDCCNSYEAGRHPDSQCLPCPNGKVPNPTQSKCVECDLNQIATEQDHQCSSCPNGKVPNPTQSECERAPHLIPTVLPAQRPRRRVI